MAKKQEITLKQQKFADEYIRTGNIYQSMLYAGYTEKYSRHWNNKILENIGIKAYIDKKQAVMAEKVDITIEYALEQLKKVYNMAIEKQDLSTAARCVELMGKKHALWIDKQRNESEVDKQELDDQQKAEAQRIINIRLEQERRKHG